MSDKSQSLTVKEMNQADSTIFSNIASDLDSTLIKKRQTGRALQRLVGLFSFSFRGSTTWEEMMVNIMTTERILWNKELRENQIYSNLM